MATKKSDLYSSLWASHRKDEAGMTSGDQSIPVHVEVLSFASLFNESAFPLAVDTYQRGFVWKDDKVRQLADDLSAYQQEADPKKPPYYMGTVLIHRHAIRRSASSLTGSSGSRPCVCCTGNSIAACPPIAR